MVVCYVRTKDLKPIALELRRDGHRISIFHQGTNVIALVKIYKQSVILIYIYNILFKHRNTEITI